MHINLALLCLKRVLCQASHSPLLCVQMRCQVYTRLSERLGLSDHLLVLNVMLAKIATNLKVYGACDDVITPTLALFQVIPLLPVHCMCPLTFFSCLLIAAMRWCCTTRTGCSPCKTCSRAGSLQGTVAGYVQQLYGIEKGRVDPVYQRGWETPCILERQLY